MNEPNAFSAEQVAALERLVRATRSRRSAPAKRARHGFPHLVFFEPGALWSDFSRAPRPTSRTTPTSSSRRTSTAAGITDGPIQRSDFERARADAAAFGGAPVLVGEWGSSPERAKDPADVYFREHQQLQDEFHFGATLWTWRESCGDPHKAQDARQGTVPYVWGEFEVDCTHQPRDRTAHRALDTARPRPTCGRRPGASPRRARPGNRRARRVRGPRPSRRGPRCLVPVAIGEGPHRHGQRPSLRASQLVGDRRRLLRHGHRDALGMEPPRHGLIVRRVTVASRARRR